MLLRAQNIGDVLHRLRTDAGLSREGLTDTVGISASFLTKLENGTRKDVSSNKLLALLDVMGYEVLVRKKGAKPLGNQNGINGC